MKFDHLLGAKNESLLHKLRTVRDVWSAYQVVYVDEN